MARRTSLIDRLENHPNLDEILGVLAQLAHISDADLPRLAEAWSNTSAVAEARDRALSPNSPLVLEVLAAFEAISALFDEDLRGEAAYVTIDPAITSLALKAVRDGVAAAYARPSLTRAEYALLLRPWRTVYPVATVDEPDLGPRSGEVKALLAALPQLAHRCHDTTGQALYEALVDRSFTDESDRADARAAAFHAAVLTSRRRIWALVRRSGAEGLSRPCTECRRGPGTVMTGGREEARVMALCLDAACALLVADTLPDSSVDVLLRPVSALVPQQRRPDASI